MSDRTTGDDLLKDVVALELQTIDTKVESLDGEIVHVKIVLQDDPDVLDSCVWGLIFAIGVLSFADAGGSRTSTSSTTMNGRLAPR